MSVKTTPHECWGNWLLWRRAYQWARLLCWQGHHTTLALGSSALCSLATCEPCTSQCKQWQQQHQPTTNKNNNQTAIYFVKFCVTSARTVHQCTFLAAQQQWGAQGIKGLSKTKDTGDLYQFERMFPDQRGWIARIHKVIRTGTSGRVSIEEFTSWCNLELVPLELVSCFLCLYGTADFPSSLLSKGWVAKVQKFRTQNEQWPHPAVVAGL